MSSYTVGITFDISDNTSDSDADWGLASGIFYWTTGRPGYAGSGYSGEAPASKTWKEGIINKNALGKAVRIIDITTGGDYGSLSGFQFSIDNTAKFWNFLESNDYYFINRAIKVYVFLGDVSYQVWGGVVSGVDFTETSYVFRCEDQFKTVHKNIPPEIVTEESYPEITEDSEGKTIPVCIGDVHRAELVNVQGQADPILLGKNSSGKQTFSCFVTAEIITPGNNPKYVLSTPNSLFPAGFFAEKDYFLRVIKGSSQTVRVINNIATVSPTTSNANTTIEVESLLDGFSFATNSSPTFEPKTSDTWFFQVMQSSINHIASNAAINSYENIEDRFGLTLWNSDLRTYTSAPEIAKSSDISAVNTVNHPFVDLSPRNMNIDGDFKRLIAIAPEKITYKTAWTTDIGASGNGYNIDTNEFTPGDINTNLLDRDRSTGYTITTNAGTEHLQLILNIFFPEELIVEDMDELYLVIDGKLTTNATHSIAFEADPVDIFGVRYGGIPSYTYFASGVAAGTVDQNYIPDYYYNPDGNLNSKESQFYGIVDESTQFKNYFKLGAGSNAAGDGFSIASTNDMKSIDHLELTIFIGVSEEVKSIELNQIGFIGMQNANLVKDDYFVKLKGETVSGSQTNTPKAAFEHILETYDGISSSDIDYGNLDTSLANTFKVGRQLRDVEKSNVYLKALAEQTFIGIFPTRTGKRGFSYWREDNVPAVTHDESTIVSNGISKFDKTQISKTYNDLEIKFSESPADNDFDKALFVSKIDQAAFPDIHVSNGTGANADVTAAPTAAFSSGLATITPSQARVSLIFSSNPSTWFTVGDPASFSGGSIDFSFGAVVSVDDGTDTIVIDLPALHNVSNGAAASSGTVWKNGTAIPDWTTYVGGMTDYGTSKSWWEICNESFDRSQYVNKLPERLSLCKWLPDNTLFEEGATNAAQTLMQNHVEWTTRQKELVDYSIPINAANAQLELLTPITFSDAIYTDDTERLGWVEKTVFDFQKKEIGVRSILEPADIITVSNIIESGDAADTYTESGDAPNNIIEG